MAGAHMELMPRMPILMSRAALVGSLTALSACAGLTSPISPSLAPSVNAAPSVAIPAARLEMTGDGRWMACFGVGVAGFSQCEFQGTVRNVGAGCATAIRGVTRFYDQNRQEMEGTFPWRVDSQGVIRPDDTVSYRTSSVPIAIVNATAAYGLTDLQWTDIACPSPTVVPLIAGPAR